MMKSFKNPKDCRPNEAMYCRVHLEMCLLIFRQMVIACPNQDESSKVNQSI